MSFLKKVRSFVSDKSNLVGLLFSVLGVFAAFRSVALLASDHSFMAWFKTLSVPGYAALALMFFFKWSIVDKLK